MRVKVHLQCHRKHIKRQVIQNLKTQKNHPKTHKVSLLIREEGRILHLIAKSKIFMIASGMRDGMGWDVWNDEMDIQVRLDLLYSENVV